MAVALLVAILCLLFAMLCLLFAFISDKGTVIRQGSSFISAFSLAICVLVTLPFIPGVVAKIPPLGQDGRVCVEINEYFEAAAEICHKFNPYVCDDIPVWLSFFLGTLTGVFFGVIFFGAIVMTSECPCRE